jgi:hypothetical protein
MAHDHAVVRVADVQPKEAHPMRRPPAGLLGLLVAASVLLGLVPAAAHADHAPEAFRIQLISLSCYYTEDNTGADEAYLTWNNLRCGAAA